MQKDVFFVLLMLKEDNTNKASDSLINKTFSLLYHMIRKERNTIIRFYNEKFTHTFIKTFFALYKLMRGKKKDTKHYNLE